MATPRLPCTWTALLLIVFSAACDDPRGPVAPLPPAPAPTSASRSLSGSIRAADTGGPLVGQITVSSHQKPSEFQVTDESGRFTFANVDARVLVHVGAVGFRATSLDLEVAGNVSRDFLLAPYEPPALDLGGTWTMSLSASRSCRTRLPAIARERKYTASIRQESSQLRIALASPTLRWRNGPHGTLNIAASLSGARLDFIVPEDSEEIDPATTELDVHDEIGPGRMLGIVGSVSGPATGRTVTATMSGFLIYRDLDLGTTAVCDALDHEVLFKR